MKIKEIKNLTTGKVLFGTGAEANSPFKNFSGDLANEHFSETITFEMDIPANTVLPDPFDNIQIEWYLTNETKGPTGRAAGGSMTVVRGEGEAKSKVTIKGLTNLSRHRFQVQGDTLFTGGVEIGTRIGNLSGDLVLEMGKGIGESSNQVKVSELIDFIKNKSNAKIQVEGPPKGDGEAESSFGTLVVDINRIMLNLTQWSYVLDLSSTKDSTLKIGNFELKNLSVFVTNDASKKPTAQSSDNAIGGGSPGGTPLPQ